MDGKLMWDIIIIWRSSHLSILEGTYGITECGIAPGSTFTYNWTVQNFGTYWWHAHYGTQYSDGIVGALILHSPNDTLKFSNTSTTSNTASLAARSTPQFDALSSTSNASAEVTYDEDLIFVVGDIYNQLSGIVLQTYVAPDGPEGTGLGNEPVPDGATLNGIGQSNCAFAPEGTECNGSVNYNFTVQPNKRYRMRVINAGSFADVLFSVDGHPLTVVEADATAIEPTVVQSVQVSIAQRYSVIIETNQTAGAFFVHADLVTDMFTYTNDATVVTQTAVMRYSGVPDTTMPNSTSPSLGNITGLLDSTTLVPAVPNTPPAATKTEMVFMTLQLTGDSTWGGFWNNTAWVPETGGNATVFQTAKAALTGSSASDSSQFILTENDIQVVDLIINNQDDGDHPIHFHGHTPWLVAAGDGNLYPGQKNITAVNPMRRDVFVIPAYTYQVIRFITNNPGLWAL
ncbi:hypothetical protein HWV62_24882 [Athelia sp. TMB]|nr:hypothetical protein HWV62_24882 [Athelia sp. TMB]